MKNLSSDQKQKLFILMGFAGVLILIGFIALRPKGADELPSSVGNVATAQTINTSAGTAPPKPSAAQTRLAAAPKPAATTVKPAVGPPIPVPERVPLAASRPDPFAPIFLPTPPPELVPTPVPPPLSIPAPPPVNIPVRASVGAPPNTVLVGLPSPRISRYNPLPGPRWVVPSVSRGPASSDTAGRASDKRLAGVIIGDSVRALLEIQQGNATGAEGGGMSEGGGAAAQVITRVVQPGDEVDGIKILRINREFENGRPVTRMYVLEGDQERYIDLRPSPSPPVSGTGGEGFSSGTPSGTGRGGFGGSPSGGFGGGSPGGFGRGSGSRPVFP